ncbi:MAG: peroxiredoxin [Methylophilaceae bacterium]
MKLNIMFYSAILLIAFIGYRNYAMAGDLLQIGSNAPAFRLNDAKGQPHELSNYAGQYVVLYFYPKDDTPGCTKEACQFRDDLAQIEKLGAKVVGISVDDSDSHAKFAQKYHLSFPLLADTDGKVANNYGALSNFLVIKIAKRYTFLIDPQGKIAKIYTKVDTSKHSQEIIDDIKKLQASV